MATDSGRAGGLRGRLPALLASMIAIGLCYLVVRTAMAALNPAAAVQLPPAEYSRLLRLRLFELMMPGRAVPRDIADLARETAISEPLAFEPFYVQARVAEDAGRLGEATRLMEEARRRRRNFAPTRLQLATYYTRAERVAGTLHELEILLGLRPEAIEPVMVELSKLVASREGRRVLAVALAREPSWQSQFFSIARAREIAPADALALLNESRRLRPGADHRQERQLFITTLIDAGDIRRARQLWLEMLPPAERSRHGLLANGGFQGRPVGQPFGWALQAIDVGRAEIRDSNTPRPHLNVDYFGGSNAVLAEQLLALPPGSYRLRYEVAGESGAGSSSLSWRVTCYSGAPELARSEMSGLAAAYRPREASFTVPAAGCDGQRLRLIAEAGDVPATVNLRVAGLEIVR